MNFIKSIFSDETDRGSSQRVALLLVIVCLLTWASLIVYRTSNIPAIPETWVWLVGAVIGGMFGGKTVSAYKETRANVETTQP
jgi:uncharacterized membrane protein YfcA